ncbi:MAG: hypothetical protein IE909_09925 [Campylobacterales bacterium]|nr:hypothetical protein [Campylobacterales bacterium]
MNTIRLSKFGLVIVLSFIFISLAARVLFPFADEPDWTVRAPGVLFGDHPVWSPYYIFRNWFNTLFIDQSVCAVQASPMSLWAYIPYQCNENFEQIIIRWLLTLFALIPMLLIVVFRRAFIGFMTIFKVRLSFDEWNHRIDALALSLLFPGMLFYLGVLAEEQLYLIVALYIFLFWGFWILISSLLVILLSIDFGNSLVAIFFVGMFFRGFEGGSVERYLSLFNYFSTLHNFALVIKDIPPGEYFTFFYPFNKLLIFLGMAEHNYFNINHLLTDIYYPHAWEIRATEQWPLEADLYINFYYIWGLPFVFMYYGIVGGLFGLAKKYDSLGLWFFSFMMTIFLVSHLRDGLYNFNDFYLIPYFLLMAYFFRRYSLYQ